MKDKGFHLREKDVDELCKKLKERIKQGLEDKFRHGVSKPSHVVDYDGHGAKRGAGVDDTFGFPWWLD